MSAQRGDRSGPAASSIGGAPDSFRHRHFAFPTREASFVAPKPTFVSAA
jgi:hypothetical protein